MVEKQTKVGETEQKKVEWKEMASLFHYAGESGMYKKLQVLQTDRGSVVIKLSEGQKGKDRNFVVFQLSKQELAYLVLQLQAIYFSTAFS